MLQGRPIYDEDGDGIEDVRHVPYDELDRYYIPMVYGVVEDLYNTRHTLMPGFRRKAEEYKEPAFYDVWDSRYDHKGLAQISPTDLVDAHEIDDDVLRF